ncbi:hypothetical protein [Ekhidna sp.]|uniref:hypothetical protein n=1 Tax=Ekhidna sp. TaxID=2608089 RepID=UPI003B591E8C
MNLILFKSLLAVMFFTLCIALNAQQGSFVDTYANYHERIIPETPNAASIGQYGEVPVDLSTGVPQIKIPIYTVSVDGAEIPIYLSYHASGIRVDQLSSSVGLGWSLNAGGGIYRTIVEYPDETGWAKPDTIQSIDQFMSQNGNGGYWVHKYITDVYSQIDNQPDDFRYQFGGQSGTFYFDEGANPANIVSKLVKDYNDQAYLEPAISNYKFSFNAYDGNGNRYVFDGAIEQNNGYTISASTGDNGTSGSEIGREYGDTGWLLGKVTTKNGYEIDFDYTPYEFDYLLTTSESITQARWCDIGTNGTTGYMPGTENVCGCEGQKTEGSAGQRYHYRTRVTTERSPKNQLIKNITTYKEKVSFYYSNDALASNWKKKLDSVVVKDLLTQKTKKFVFGYSRFSGDPRLKLEYVREYGFDGSKKPAHVFTYYSGNLPPIDSYSKDYHNYYNGKINNGLVPFTRGLYTHVFDGNYHDFVADRQPDFYYLKMASLHSITYPTGGRTKFTYEPNLDTVSVGGNPVFDHKKIKLSNTIYDSVRIEGPNTIFSVEIEIDNPLGKNDLQGLFHDHVIEHIGFSSECEYDPSYPNIDCAKWNLYPDGSTSSVFPTDIIVFADGIRYLPSGGFYRLELKVETSVLNANPNADIYVELSWVDERQERVNYCGGLRLLKKENYGNMDKLVGATMYRYKNLLGDNFLIDNTWREYGDGANKYVFSSNNRALDPFTIKAGYFNTEVSELRIGNNDTIESIHYYSQLPKRKNLLSQNDKIAMVDESGVREERLFEDNYTNTSSLSFYTIGDKDMCVSFAGQPIPSPNPIEIEQNQLAYDYPNHRLFTSRSIQNRVERQIYYVRDGINVKEKEEVTNISFNSHALPEEKLVTLSDGRTLKTEYTYSFDHPELSPISGSNCITIPITQKTYINDILVDGQAVELDSFGNVIKVYRYNRGQGSNSSGLDYIPNDFEWVQEFELEDGKPISSVNNAGIKTTYIWGHGGKYPIAKIVNSDPAIVASQLNVNTEDLANLGSSYLTAVNSLRSSLSNSSITTFDYTETGLTEIKDSNNRSTHYKRDGLGRLVKVLDDQLHLLTSYRYFYYSLSPLHH